MSGRDRISMKLYYLHYGRKNFNAILSRDGEPYIEPTQHNTTIDVV